MNAIVRSVAVWAVCLGCALQIVAAPGPPRIVDVLPPPGTVTSLTNITVTFSEPVTGVGILDFLVNGIPLASTLTGAGDEYTFSFEQPAYGAVAISWESVHTIVDLENPPVRFDENHASSTWQYNLVDQVAPAVAVLTPAQGVVVRTLTQIEVSFTEPVLGIDAGDLLINGQGASSVSVVAAGRYLFTFEQPTDGLVQVAWDAAHGIRDFANNPLGGGSWIYTLDQDFGLANIRINEFLASNVTGIGDGDVPPETNDWIEIWNYGTTTVDLNGFALTDDANDPGKWTFPSTNLAPGQFLVVFASEKDRKTGSRLHTNFKLNPNGEYLALFNAELPRVVITEFAPEYPEQRNDHSYGYDATNGLKYFAMPTPGAANGASAISGVLSPPHFNVARGLFETPFSLIISASEPGATILYTIDGTEPTVGATNTLTYSGTLTISNVTVLRAAAFKTGLLPSLTVTHTYLFLDQVVVQPNRPVGFPTNWGPNSGFPGGLVPADYEMDMDPMRVDPNNTNSPIDAVKLQRLKDGLRELPTVSIVMKLGDLFDSRGIYQYTGTFPSGTGSAIETGTPGTKPQNKKPCSVEMFLPDGTTAFATTCGIDLHGNASRNPVKNPKHGFKLNFRGDYGPPTLDYQVFEDSAVREFDDMLLRPDFNSSWRHWSDTAGQGLGAFQRTRATRTRDAWMKDSMREMGGVACHNRFCHLYLNGLYWGVFELGEEPTKVFAKNTLGGGENDFDIVDQGVMKSGTINFYNAMLALPAAGTLAQYDAYRQYLDLVEFTDYMLLHFFMGHQDWSTSVTKNWYAMRKRVSGPEGTFKYIPWDGECILLNEDVNRVTVTTPPSGLHTKLVGNAEYRLAFADRIHRHMIAPGAALTPPVNTARWKKWQAVMDKPIVAESARWGDYRRDVHQSSEGVYQLYTRENHWLAENNRMMGYFSNRNGIVLGQLRTANLYPAVAAPVFNQQGGLAARGFNLTMTASNTIHYTLDGSDPRVYGTGAVSPQAATYGSPITLSNSVVVKARALFGTNWSALNEASFMVDALNSPLRITEIMYNPIGGDAYEFIEIQNVGSATIDVGNFSLSGVTYVFPPSTFLAPGQIIVLGSDASPGSWASRYPGVTAFGRFAGSLANGGEKLAIHDPAGNIVHSVDYDDEDGWATQPDGGGYSLQLVSALGDPDAVANWVASSVANGTPGTHGAPPPVGAITINEVMADNLTAVPNGGTFPDWVEIRNSGASPTNLAGWSLSDDGNVRKFVFPSATVPAGGYLVVWCDTNNLAPGLHTGFALGRNGETVSLYNANTSRIDSVTFGLQLADYSVGRVANTWQLTAPTPNAANVVATLASSTNLIINEWLANATPGGSDWVELYNSAGQPVALEGLYLGDGAAVFRISSLSFVSAGGFVQLLADELSGADHLDFKLSASGGAIVFYDGSGAERDRVTYGAQTQGVSQGRLPNGASTIVSFPASQSPGASNYVLAYSGPRLNEVLAINDTATTNALGRTPDWVELRNTNSTAFDLSGMRLTTDPEDPSRWAFPTNTTIAANGYLIVWFDDGQPASTMAGPVLNTGYSIDGESGEVHLLNAAGQIVDSIVFGFQVPDLTIGVNGSGWTLLAGPTPGTGNAAAATLGTAATLRLNEWMADPERDDDWFEIYNNADQAVALSGVYVTDNLSIAGSTQAAFSALSFIGARGFIRVIADGDPSDGRNHVNFALNALGEALRIYSPALGAIDTIYFDTQETGVSEGRLPDAGAAIVRFSTTPSPAESNYLPLPNAVINEVLSHTDNPLEDAVELFNPSADSANIGGWYLSDSVRNLKKYRIASGTSLAGLGFKVFYQNELTGGAGALVPFTLDSAHGDAVYLSAADAGGNLNGYRSVAKFGAAANGVSFGRYLTSAGIDFPPLKQRTFGVDNPGNVTDFRTGNGVVNAEPKVGPVAFNEVMFHPPDAGTNDNTADEFLELHNITTNSVALYDPAHATNTWRIRGGVDFEFPPGVTLSSRAFALVVSFNPVTNTTALNAFRSTYGIPPSVPIFGPYRGKLDNGGENIELLRPDNPQTSGPDAGFVPYLLTDRVEYDDGSSWPLTADGGGASLQRRRMSDYGNDPVNWKGEGPTPGRPNVVGSTYVDADGDGISDAWEGPNGLNSSNRADADQDADSDGESNLQEYLAGTNPQDSDSYLVAPMITSHPQGTNGIAGFDVTFSVSAVGSGPLVYKWRVNGRDIPGATSPTFVLSDVQPDDTGQYEAVVMNARGYAVSHAAVLIVNLPPRFTLHPQSRVLTNGNNVTFTVAALGTGLLSYQWQFNGTNIGGATGTSYSVLNAQIHDSGSYRCVVTDDIASIPSNPAMLEVRQQPIIIVNPVSQTVVVGGTASFSVRATGSTPMGFRWRKNGAYIPTASFYNVNDTNFTFVIENVQTSDAAGYACVVTNAALPGGRLSAVATLTVLVPPAIIVQPTNQTAHPRENITFAVRATGSAPLSYQWLFNGDELPGATSTNLVLTDVQLANAGNYSVVVTNLAGSVTSATAALAVGGDLRLRIMQSGGALLSFDAVANKTYIIEYRGSLGTGSWQTLQNIPAGATREVDVPDPAGTNRFYRLRTPGGS